MQRNAQRKQKLVYFSYAYLNLLVSFTLVQTTESSTPFVDISRRDVGEKIIHGKLTRYLNGSKFMRRELELTVKITKLQIIFSRNIHLINRIS